MNTSAKDASSCSDYFCTDCYSIEWLNSKAGQEKTRQLCQGELDSEESAQLAEFLLTSDQIEHHQIATRSGYLNHALPAFRKNKREPNEFIWNTVINIYMRKIPTPNFHIDSHLEDLSIRSSDELFEQKLEYYQALTGHLCFYMLTSISQRKNWVEILKRALVKSSNEAILEDLSYLIYEILWHDQVDLLKIFFDAHGKFSDSAELSLGKFSLLEKILSSNYVLLAPKCLELTHCQIEKFNCSVQKSMLDVDHIEKLPENWQERIQTTSRYLYQHELCKVVTAYGEYKEHFAYVYPALLDEVIQVDWSVWPDIDPEEIPSSRVKNWNNYWAGKICTDFIQKRKQLEPIWNRLERDQAPIYREYYLEMKTALECNPKSAKVQKLAQKYPVARENQKLMADLKSFRKEILEKHDIDLMIDFVG